MTSPTALTAELVASADALRRLARDLIGTGDADDLVQETMLRALRNPPADPRGLRAWLLTVLRNLAHNHRRDRRRRRRHEETASDAWMRRAVDDAAFEQAELRAVTQALFELPEPYQSTLAQRYFGNRTPTQIAARSATPIATVKSRLQRGLTLLRRELDRRRGPAWRATLAFALGLGPNAFPAAAATAGLLLMANLTKILIGVVSAALCAWLLLSLDQAPPQPPASVTTDSARVIGRATNGDTAAAASRRERVPTAQLPAIDLAHSFSYRLRCRVVDRDGLIVPDAFVSFAPEASAMNRWPEAVGSDGEVLLEWRAKVPTMTVWVGLEVGGSAQLLRELAVHAGREATIALLAASGGQFGTCAAARSSAATDCLVCHRGSLRQAPFDTRLTARRLLHPDTVFADLLLGDTGARSPDHVGPPPPPGHLDDLSETTVADSDSPGPAKQRAFVTGVVRGPHGEAVGGATVAVCAAEDVPLRHTRSKADGSFRLTVPSRGRFEIRAGGGRHGIGRAAIDVDVDVGSIGGGGGRAIARDLFLLPEQTLTGRVVLPLDASPVGWRVGYVGRDASWVDGADLPPDGSFELANLPGRSGSLLLWSGTSRLPVAYEPDAATGGQTVFDLRMLGMPRGRLRITIDQPTDVRASSCQVYAFQLETGRGTIMTDKGKGVLELAELPPGFYRVVAIGAPFARIDLGEHWVDGQSLVDLGHRSPPAPGILRVLERQRAPNLELYLRRPETDVAAAAVLAGQTEFLLPAGEWVMMWGEPANPAIRTFRIASGGTFETVVE